MLIVLGPLLLLAFVSVPRCWANRQVVLMTRLAGSATVAAFVTALACVLQMALGGRVEHVFAAAGIFKFGIYFDVLSATMLLLISFLGAIVTRYALNYLKGDDEQGHFLKWLCVTVGAV